MQMDVGKVLLCKSWTAEEDATLLAHLRANEWSHRDFSGKHIFIVMQGGGGGTTLAVWRQQAGCATACRDACAESDTY
jgi:hypothetical protein